MKKQLKLFILGSLLIVEPLGIALLVVDGEILPYFSDELQSLSDESIL